MSASLRSQRWSRLFPHFLTRPTQHVIQVVHPTAVYEEGTGDLYTLLINGKQPQSQTDLFILWQLRMLSTCLIQSGKTLREEPQGMEYAPYLKEAVGIEEAEYMQAFSKKVLAVLTREFTPGFLRENEAYLRGLMEKWFYEKEVSGVFESETFKKAKITRFVEVLDVGQVLDRMISDVKKHLEGEDVSEGRIISVEIGSSTTSPLYTDPDYRNQIDTLLLSRYKGPINQEAVGPFLANIKHIETLFSKKSSIVEKGTEFPDQSTWTFEHWSRVYDSKNI